MSTPPPVPPDSPDIPPVPPQVPPASPSYQQPYYPQGAPDYAPKSTPGGSTRALLFGCVGLLIIGLVIGGMGIVWVYKKGRAIAENPEQFIAEMVVKGNPQLELLSVDKSTGVVTFKDKTSGEPLTISFDDLKAGKLKVRKADGTEVSLGRPSVDLTVTNTPEVETAAGNVRLPDWLDHYPGKHIVVKSSRQEKGTLLKGTYTITTDDSIEAASEAYIKALQSKNFFVNDITETDEPDGGKTASSTVEKDGVVRVVRIEFLLDPQTSAPATRTLVQVNYEQTSVEK